MTAPRPVQLEVLRLKAEGLSDEKIAAKLWISGSAVKTRLRRLYRAIGARNGPHAVAIGYENGWLGEGRES